MIDGDNPEYINDNMINSALNFIKRALDNNDKVFIYCSLGESRSPSIALMYLLENNLIEQEDAITLFKLHYYNKYSPKSGNLKYIQNRWLKKT